MMSARLFVTSNDTYTGEINRITYTFTRLSDNQTATYIDGGSNTSLTGFYDDYLTLTHGSPNGIRINADSAMPTSDDLLYYTLTATVLFKSGLSRTATANIIVSDDSTAIVMSSQSVMFNVINAAWTTQYGESIGRNNFFKLDLMSMTGTLDFSTAGASISNLLTANGSYLLKYLPNLTGLNLDGCTNITNVNSSITQIDFTYMTALQNLSIQNCTGITGDIDVTMCTDIRQVDASGTNVSIIMPTEPKVTKYEVGTPTSINLENPTVLTPAGVAVDGYINVDSLVIKNIPNSKSYATFDKITTFYLGSVEYGSPINGMQRFWTQYMNTAGMSSITVEGDVEEVSSFYVYRENGSRAWVFTSITELPYTYNIAYGWLHGPIVRGNFEVRYNTGTYFRVKNGDTGDVIFEWRKA